jgi:hypothetical protein
MRTIGKLVLGLVVAAFFGVAATPALAEQPVWQVCTNLGEEIGSYENLGCTIGKEGGKYEWLENEEAEKVQGTGTLRLSDTKTLAGKSEVECSMTAKGVVGPHQSGRVESITIASCKRLKVCENVETVRPVNLPWQTELFEEGGRVRDKITEVSGEPGWSVTCKTVLGSKTDRCETEAGKEGSTAEVNEATHGYVLGEFGPTAKADCTEGGKEAGEMGGIITTEGNGGAGLKLSFNVFEWSPVQPGKVPIEPNELTVFIKNRLKIAIPISVNGVEPIAFKLQASSTCGAVLAAKGQCEDKITAKAGTAANTPGRLEVATVVDNIPVRLLYKLKST